MKRLSYKNIIWIFLAGLLYLTSCEKKFPQDYTPYHPTPVTAANVDLKYAPLQAYPASTVIKSDTPTLKIDGVYSFGIDTIISPTGGKFVQSKFGINKETGVISYDNTSNTISAGDYTVSVVVSNPSGIAVVDSAFHLSILSVPVSATVDHSEVKVNALQQGVIAIVSYKDESPDHSITSVAYSLASPVTGYSIDATSGKISKTTAAATDTTVKLSVVLTTNLGTRTFPDLVTVHVGPPPTIKYVQKDGSTLLTKVTLSPWTGYTTHAPVLTGMESSGGWEILLPDTINAAAFTISSDGAVTVLPNMNLPLGDFKVGVKVTNGSGVSFEFPDQFTIHVETRWETKPVFTEDFANATATAIPVHNYNASLYSWGQNGSALIFQAVAVTAKKAKGARVFKGKETDKKETVMVLALPMDASWHNMRVSFSELFGYADNALDKWSRTLSFGYDTTDVSSGTYNPANWNMVMPANDSDWPSSSGWKTGAFTDIPAQDFGGIDNTQKTIFINWWYADLQDNDTKGAQFIINNIKVQVSRAFDAEEQ
jgi:hypothetical protein